MNQRELVLRYMHEFGSITDSDARQAIGCTRIAARINEIIASGVKIIKTMERGKNRFGKPTHYARYRLG